MKENEKEKERKGRIKQHVISVLRQGSYKWQGRTDAMRAARVDRGKYLCAVCGGTFGRKEVSVDHIEPVVDPGTGFIGWNTYINRMLADKDGWQVLCKKDHDVKTEIEDVCRKEIKRSISDMKERMEKFYESKGKDDGLL